MFGRHRSLFFFFLFCLLTPAAGWGEVAQETLPNGLRVVLIKNPGTTSVSVDLWVRAGSRFEPPKINGISHFVEHLLFKGTSRRTAQDISREIAAAGGYFNAYTHWEYTQIHISILPAHLDLAMDVLSDIAQNSLLTEEMVAQERKVILEEISLGKIYPPSYILNLVSKTLFAENTLEMPISGTEDSVKAIRRRDLLQFYRRQYVPNNAYLTIVGNVDGEVLPGLIRQRFGSWPGKDKGSSSPLPPVRQNQFREVRERKFLDQAIVVLALQAVGARDIDRPSFEIINAVLGSGGTPACTRKSGRRRAFPTWWVPSITPSPTPVSGGCTWGPTRRTSPWLNPSSSRRWPEFSRSPSLLGN